MFSLRLGQKMFKVYYDNMKISKGRNYLVTPITKVSHISLCDVQLEVLFNCSNRFPKFRRQSHFLDEDGSYIYLLHDLSWEKICLKRKHMAFQKCLGFIDGIVPFRATPKKQKKQHIKTCFWWKLSLERRDVIFGE